MDRFKLIALVCSVLLAGNACAMGSEDGYDNEGAALTDAEIAVNRAVGATGYPKIQLMASSEVGAKLRPSVRMLVLTEDDIPYEAMNRLLSLNPDGQISLEDFRNWINGLDIDDEAKNEYVRTVEQDWWIKFEYGRDVLHIKQGIGRSRHAVLINNPADFPWEDEWFGFEFYDRFCTTIDPALGCVPFPETRKGRRKTRKLIEKQEIAMKDIRTVHGWEDAKTMIRWPRHNFDLEVSVPYGYVHIN